MGLNQEVFPRIQKDFFAKLVLKKVTLDIDSSVITRYGTQEGAKRGYNPHKPGRNSHHPLMAYIADVRKEIDKLPKSKGKQLEIWNDRHEDQRYRYSAYYTNLELPIESVWLLYRDRGDAENRIKELKYDFGIDGFNFKSFWATEACFRFILVAYNLMSLFRQCVYQSKHQSILSTLRFKCFALGAWISNHAGKKTLKISLNPKRHRWLDGLFAKADGLSPPFINL